MCGSDRLGTVQEQERCARSHRSAVFCSFFFLRSRIIEDWCVRYMTERMRRASLCFLLLDNAQSPPKNGPNILFLYGLVSGT